MAQIIKMELLKDVKGLGKVGGEIEVTSKEQVDYFTKAGKAKLKEGQTLPAEPPKKAEKPGVITTKAVQPESKK